MTHRCPAAGCTTATNQEAGVTMTGLSKAEALAIDWLRSCAIDVERFQKEAGDEIYNPYSTLVAIIDRLTSPPASVDESDKIDLLCTRIGHRWAQIDGASKVECIRCGESATPPAPQGGEIETMTSGVNSTVTTGDLRAEDDATEKLARRCESFMVGVKKIYDGTADRADMWFFELYHHLVDCASALRSTQAPAADRYREGIEDMALATAVRTALGCFAAAEFEGLSDAVNATDDERLRDLLLRRVMHAQTALQSTGLEPDHGD